MSLLFKGKRGSSSVIQRPEREVSHSPPSSTEVKNEWSYASIPPVRLRGVDSKHITFFTSSLCRHKTKTWRLRTKCFGLRATLGERQDFRERQTHCRLSQQCETALCIKDGENWVIRKVCQFVRGSTATRPTRQHSSRHGYIHKFYELFLCSRWHKYGDSANTKLTYGVKYWHETRTKYLSNSSVTHL
jgi:hypothetical protein